MTNSHPIPPGFHTVTPHLVCRNAPEAIEFYKRAFNAESMHTSFTPDGKHIIHATIRIGDSMVMLNEEFPNWGIFSPLSTKAPGSIVLHLYTPDVDSLWKQAIDAGCTVKMPLMDMFWGSRYGKVTDPYGHEWALASHTHDPSPEEVEEGAKKAFAKL